MADEPLERALEQIAAITEPLSLILATNMMSVTQAELLGELQRINRIIRDARAAAR